MALHVQHNQPDSPATPIGRPSPRLSQPGPGPASPPSVCPATVAADNAITLSADPFTAQQAKSCAKLIYSPNGVLVVQSDAGHWVVPPTTALRLMPGTPYSLRKADKVQVRIIELSDAHSARLYENNCLYRLTPLLRELLESLSSRVTGHRADNDSSALCLIDQLTEAGRWQDETRHRCRTVPKDPRVAHICDHLYHNLDTDKTLQEWASELKNDTRTLHRLFIQEFGMPFVQWRQQIRLMAALEWLAEGRQIMDVALDLGYQTQSAFAAMFRRNLGITPSSWQDKRHPHERSSRYMTMPAKHSTG